MRLTTNALKFCAWCFLFRVVLAVHLDQIGFEVGADLEKDGVQQLEEQAPATGVAAVESKGNSSRYPGALR